MVAHMLFTLLSVALIMLGLFSYQKNNPIHILMFGLAIAINYYSAFCILFFELSNTKKYLTKILSITLELIPINIVYFVEHFIFTNKSACFWLPDFQLWNDLFDLSCMKIFYWFWFAYILYLCYALILSTTSHVPDIEKAIVGGLGIYTMFEFFVHIDLTFYIYWIAFIIAFSIKCLRKKDITNIYMLFALGFGIMVTMFAYLFEFGAISNIINLTLNKLSFLGFKTILLTMMAAICINFIWQWHSQYFRIESAEV